MVVSCAVRHHCGVALGRVLVAGAVRSRKRADRPSRSRRPDMERSGRAAFLGVVVLSTFMFAGKASEDERNLVEHLFDRQNYNPLIRPVETLSDTITVGFEMTLIQLIMLDEKNQVMKTNIWLRLRWNDSQLRWTPKQFENITVLRIPSDRIWKPDIVLFNNADGKFEVTFKANVLVEHTGDVMWIPCSIYKSSCIIDVQYFPFDEQTCNMIYGSWTYSADEVQLEPYTEGFFKVDLTDYEKSGSWDVVDVPGSIMTTYDENGGHNVSKATYKIHMRRKTLFYTINLIVPCVLISCLSMCVFILPASAGEKVTMAIAILLALVVFLQVLVKNLLPPSSINLPLFAKYLLFTILTDVACIANAVIVMNWNFKTPRTHRMPGWVRRIFVDWLPRVLWMRRPPPGLRRRRHPSAPGVSSSSLMGLGGRAAAAAAAEAGRRDGAGARPRLMQLDLTDVHRPGCPNGDSTLRQRCTAAPSSRHHDQQQQQQQQQHLSVEMNKAIEAVRFISAHLKNEDDFIEVIDDWRYVSLVMDRLLFFVYLVVTAITTCMLLSQAPLLNTFNQATYKDRIALERKCRDQGSPYSADCDVWYPIICLDPITGVRRPDLVSSVADVCANWTATTGGTS